MLAGVIVVTVVIAPILRFALLTLVLGLVLADRRPIWLGRAYGWAEELQLWAMPDVFLLAFWVAYARLASTVSVQLGVGAICLILAGLGALFTRATLNRRAVWEAIRPAPRTVIGEAPEPLVCRRCEWEVPAASAGCACPRCGTKIHARSPLGLVGPGALTLAAALLYIPANLLPIATIPVGLGSMTYTVLQGVADLLRAHVLGLALLVFTASFAIPILKLVGLAWCLGSVLRRSPRQLRLKTRVFRLVEEVGRWSLVDPFTIACFVPVTQFNGLISSRAEAGAPAFTSVVLLTVVAARLFDPRLMWDADRRTT